MTLLEILVALVVAGLVLAMLGGGLRLGLRGVSAQDREPPADTYETLDRTLRDLIEDMDPGSFIDPPRVAGTSSSLAFVADVAVGAARRRAAILLRARDGHLDLTWRDMPHREAFAATQDAGTTSVLATHVQAITLSYRAADGSWQDSWTRPALPAAIRMRLVAVPGGRQTWPTLTFAPRRERPEE